MNDWTTNAVFNKRFNLFIKRENNGIYRNWGRNGAWTINLDELDGIEDLMNTRGIIFSTPKCAYYINTDEAFQKGTIKILAGYKKLIVALENWKILPPNLVENGIILNEDLFTHLRNNHIIN